MSSYNIGLDYNFNVGVESTYGTFASSVKAWAGDPLSYTPILEEEEMLISPTTSQNEAEDAFLGKAEYGFDIELAIRDWEWLSWIMGTEGTVTGTDPYTHPLSLANTIPSLSMEAIPVSDHGASYKFVGGKINEAVIKAAVGEQVTASLNIFTKIPSVNTSPASAEAVNSSELFKFHGLTITVNGVSYEDAAESLEMTVSRNLKYLYGLSSKDPVQIGEGRRACKFNMDARITDETLVELLLNGTEFATTLIFTDTANHKVTKTFPKCIVNNVGSTIGEEVLKDKIEVRVLSDWTASVVDSISDYLS